MRTRPGPFPFVDTGNRYLTCGSSYSPQVLAGMTQPQVAQAPRHPGSRQAQAIGTTASYYIAAICRVTGSKPATACTTTGTRAAATKLPAPR